MDTPTETPTTEEQRAPDQDTAIEQAFAAGTLPGDDRRVEAAPEPNQEPAEITADPAADPAAPATPTPPASVTISAEDHQKSKGILARIESYLNTEEKALVAELRALWQHV